MKLRINQTLKASALLLAGLFLFSALGCQEVLEPDGLETQEAALCLSGDQEPNNYFSEAIENGALCFGTPVSGTLAKVRRGEDDGYDFYWLGNLDSGHYLFTLSDTGSDLDLMIISEDDGGFLEFSFGDSSDSDSLEVDLEADSYILSVFGDLKGRHRTHGYTLEAN